MACDVRMVFIYLKDCFGEMEERNLQQCTNNPESLKYLLTGPLQKKFPDPYWASPMAQWVKSLPAGDTGDVGLIPGSGRSPGEGNGNPLQYSCLKNPMDQRSLAGYSPWSCSQT